MAYTQGGTSKGAAIVAISLSDQGKTWGKPFTQLANPGKGVYCINPSFLRLANGDHLMSYIYVVSAALPYYSHNLYRRSTDDGKIWSDQFIMAPHLGWVAIHNDRLQTLSNGRILAVTHSRQR